MGNIANDGNLVRGSIDITINGYLYTLVDYERDNGEARSENDYDKDGKPLAASHVEDFEMITGTIRLRSNMPVPPRWEVFAYSGKNWYIKNLRESGSTAGLKQYAVEIQECINGVVTVT